MAPKDFLARLKAHFPDCMLIDLYPVMKARRQEAYLPDAYHLTALGNRIVAEEIARRLREEGLTR